MIQEELCVLMALLCRSREPLLRHLLILVNILAQQKQLAQNVLCLRVAFLSGVGEIVHRFAGVLGHTFAGEIQLAQLIGGELISAVGRLLVLGYRLIDPILLV